MNLEQIKKNYSKMPIEKIEEMAGGDTAGYELAILSILHHEVIERSSNDYLVRVAKAQQEELFQPELLKLVDQVKKCSCPDCDRSHVELRSNWVRNVISFILMTTNKKHPYIACPICLAKTRKKNFGLTFFFGWWGFPWGLIKTPISMISHFLDQKNESENTNEMMSDFVVKNLGVIRVDGMNSPKVKEKMIQYNNVG